MGGKKEDITLNNKDNFLKSNKAFTKEVICLGHDYPL